LLQRDDEDGATVGDVAAKFGFWHSGQFAADYWRAFGELPSVTLGRSMAADSLCGPGHQPSWIEAAA
jgi:AraC-like DNA-binding protein